MKPGDAQRAYPADQEWCPQESLLVLDAEFLRVTIEGLGALERLLRGAPGYRAAVEEYPMLSENDIALLQRTRRWASRLLARGEFAPESGEVPVLEDLTFGALRLLKTGALAQARILEGERDELRVFGNPSRALESAIEAQLSRLRASLASEPFAGLSIGRKWQGMVDLCEPGVVPNGLRIGMRLRDRELRLQCLPLLQAWDDGDPTASDRLIAALLVLIRERMSSAPQGIEATFETFAERLIALIHLQSGRRALGREHAVQLIGSADCLFDWLSGPHA